eukprot:Awhi_evm1s5491
MDNLIKNVVEWAESSLRKCITITIETAEYALSFQSFEERIFDVLESINFVPDEMKHLEDTEFLEITEGISYEIMVEQFSGTPASEHSNNFSNKNRMTLECLLFITLMRLRQGTSVRHLAALIDFSYGHINDKINLTIALIEKVLSPIFCSFSPENVFIWGKEFYQHVEIQ